MRLVSALLLPFFMYSIVVVVGAVVVGAAAAVAAHWSRCRLLGLGNNKPLELFSRLEDSKPFQAQFIGYNHVRIRARSHTHTHNRQTDTQPDNHSTFRMHENQNIAYSIAIVLNIDDDP